MRRLALALLAALAAVPSRAGILVEGTLEGLPVRVELGAVVTDKAVVTPGPIAPARELLGDMLLELKQPTAALKEYQAVMKKEPNRFRAIYGAARAASSTSSDSVRAS